MDVIAMDYIHSTFYYFLSLYLLMHCIASSAAILLWSSLASFFLFLKCYFCNSGCIGVLVALYEAATILFSTIFFLYSLF
ncbi:hypothetical protein V8B55DRAFT_1536168 [Mucor lusitanicus]